MVHGVLTFAQQADEKAGHGQYGENDEENLAYAHGAGGNSTKAEKRGNQCDDEKYYGVMQHGGSPYYVGVTARD